MRKVRKYALFGVIIACEIIAIRLLSKTFGVGTENTWLGLLGASVIGLTVAALLLINARSMDEGYEYPDFFLFELYKFVWKKPKNALYFIAFIIIFGILFINTVVLIEAVSGKSLG